MYQQLDQQISNIIDLSKEELTEFHSILSQTKILRKQILIQPGDDVYHEYYVVKGCLKAYCIDQAGDQHIIQFAIEDWWISDFEAFFSNSPAQLYVEAVEDSLLLGIHRDSLKTLYQRIPKFERFFRIKTTGAFVALRGRILSTMQKTGTERYLDFCRQYPTIEKRVTNYHIANYLGIKPESLSRIRKELFQVQDVP